MAELKLKIDNRDFSTFAGFYYTDSSFTENNEQLDEYIKLYKGNKDIKYFQIQCERNVEIHTIAYIIEQVKEKYFIRTDFEDGVKNYKYWLCFYKEDKEEGETN